MKDSLSNDGKLKRILIIHPEGNTFNNPSLTCIIDLFLKKNIEVDICYEGFPFISMPSYKGLRLIPYGRWKRRFQSIISSLPSVCISKFFMSISVFIDYILKYRKYDLVIGVDRLGGIEAGLLYEFTKVPYVFISFEIMFACETTLKYKLLEINLLKNVSAWIVQDKIRGEQLQYENKLDPQKRILLPLASKGAAIIAKGSRLRDMLDIPKEKKVAIVIGSISHWSMIQEILDSIEAWSEDWALIIHERYGRAHGLVKKDIRLQGKVFSSNFAVDKLDDMGNIFSGVSVGLAFYKPQSGHSWRGYFIGANLKYLGLSSGKIATYLKYGIPVIMNNIGLYSEEARKYQFGFVVNNPEQIGTCLNEIKDSKYRENAKEYYFKHLDFDNYEQMLWSKINQCLR